VSSLDLAKRSGTTGPQVRKDLSHFGSFGTRGRGYEVPELRRRLREILGLTQGWKVALIGAGRVGAALFAYPDFRRRGFEIVAIFDNDPGKVGRRWGGIRIRSIEDLPRTLRRNRIEMVILAVPGSCGPGGGGGGGRGRCARDPELRPGADPRASRRCGQSREHGRRAGIPLLCDPDGSRPGSGATPRARRNPIPPRSPTSTRSPTPRSPTRDDGHQLARPGRPGPAGRTRAHPGSSRSEPWTCVETPGSPRRRSTPSWGPTRGSRWTRPGCGA
jgi:hypothetical protein